MTAILLKLAPWIAGVLGVFAVSAFLTHKVDNIALSRVQSAYDADKVTWAHSQAAAEKAAADALATQIAQRKSTEARNAELQDSLQKVQADAVAAHRDADFASRLLAAARKAASRPDSDPVPAAQGGQKPDGASEASGDRPAPDILGLTAAAATECREAIQQYATIQLELDPQLQR
jgi:hypothetical protein